VQDIVSQFSGTIHIASQTGFGTKVTVRFPYHTEPLSKSVVAKEAAAQRGSETILLVEDNADLRDLVSIFLSSAGYRVLAVGRPSEAEALWNTEGEKIDLLVSDMVMPEKTGIELAKGLSARKPELKTLLISGYAPSRNKLGEASFLQKPFTRNELLATVRTVCDGKPTHFGSTQGSETPSKARPKLAPFLFGPAPGST
jgi:DNA-binding NtrC family response regulator